VTANALYGFTGAGASHLQCVPLADSCLALGAASCRRAIDLITQLAREGQLGEVGRRARVIYGQTDSLFLLVPGASVPQALQLGELAARLVSERFPDPMELKFEQVMRPFLLLHVNRYAGRWGVWVWVCRGAGGECIGPSELQSAGLRVQLLVSANRTAAGGVQLRGSGSCSLGPTRRRPPARPPCRSFTSEQQYAEGQGSLVAKGLKSMWRQSAPYVRSVLHGVLQRVSERASERASEQRPAAAEGGCRLQPGALGGTLVR
jgi:hypothetical protein